MIEYVEVLVTLLSILASVLIYLSGWYSKRIKDKRKELKEETQKETTDDLTLDGVCKKVDALAEDVKKGFAEEAYARKKLEKDLREHKDQTVKNQTEMKLMLNGGMSDLRELMSEHHFKLYEKTTEILGEMSKTLARHDAEIDNLKNKS